LYGKAGTKLKQPIYTEIVPAGPFYAAEDYHQDFYQKNRSNINFTDGTTGAIRGLSNCGAARETAEMMSRRALLTAGVALSAFALSDKFSGAETMTTGATTDYRKLTDMDWRQKLTANQYMVLRQHGTERPGSSPLDKEKRKGTFSCAGCDLPLFSSDTKFESGTGWPSFYQPLANAVETKTDRSMFMTRTEVHCARCLGHLGHVFDDGPPPTGLRYCMNGVALKFAPQVGSSS
jgi:peptide-methionine (R)-S-oxide reductase